MSGGLSAVSGGELKLASNVDREERSDQVNLGELVYLSATNGSRLY